MTSGLSYCCVDPRLLFHTSSRSGPVPRQRVAAGARIGGKPGTRPATTMQPSSSRLAHQLHASHMTGGFAQANGTGDDCLRATPRRRESQARTPRQYLSRPIRVMPIGDAADARSRRTGSPDVSPHRYATRRRTGTRPPNSSARPGVSAMTPGARTSIHRPNNPLEHEPRWAPPCAAERRTCCKAGLPSPWLPRERWRSHQCWSSPSVLACAVSKGADHTL